MKVKAIVLVFLIVFLKGCATFNYSDHKYFEHFIGQKIPLTEDVIVCSSRYYSEFNLEKKYIESLYSEYHDGVTKRNCGRDEYVTTLPKGHLIEIKAVYKKVSRGLITTSAIIAIGEFRTIEGEMIKFQHEVGAFGKVYRAPWEAASVESPRTIN